MQISGRVIFELPIEYKVNDVSGVAIVASPVAGSIKVFGNFIEFIPNAQITAGNKDFEFSGITNPIPLPVDDWKVYVKYDRYYERQYSATSSVRRRLQEDIRPIQYAINEKYA